MYHFRLVIRLQVDIAVQYRNTTASTTVHYLGHHTYMHPSASTSLGHGLSMMEASGNKNALLTSGKVTHVSISSQVTGSRPIVHSGGFD